MADRDDLVQAETRGDRLDVGELLGKAVFFALRLIRAAKAQKVDRDRPAASRGQVRDQVVVDVRVVWEAVQQQERRTAAGEVADVDAAVIARDPMLYEQRRPQLGSFCRHVLLLQFVPAMMPASRSGCSSDAKCPACSSMTRRAAGTSDRVVSRSGGRDQSWFP